MHRFQDYVYSRPDMPHLLAELREGIVRFSQSQDAEQTVAALQALYALRKPFESARELASIRHTVDTTDAFYKAENDFFDEELPAYEAAVSDFYRALLDSAHRAALEAIYGPQLFRIAACRIRVISQEVIEDLQQENRLASAYTQLLASAQIPFRGETLNLSQLSAFQSDPQRDTRREAAAAKWAFMAENGDQLDALFDELVAVRTRIAQKLGYPSFVELAYDRLMRSDYGPVEAARFREAVQNSGMPLAAAIRRRQAESLGLAPDALRYYDEEVLFPDGNARPQGNAQWIIAQAAEMYGKLSPETGSFFQYMMDAGLMDLEARSGKAGGGYCTFIPDKGAPFIFTNFNGTEGDVYVLTHEVGHALQVYMSRNQAIGEYHWPTYEAAEIHSMSMEYFTRPYMELFFKEQAEKYRKGHLWNTLLFLPYGCAVDEFQHEVYTNPGWTAAERHACWRRIEQRYLPWRHYEGQPRLEAGGFWQIQRHIYLAPFYYLDYVLAQICAFQYWFRSMENPEKAFESYLKLCAEGGSRSFTELVEFAGLQSPFEPGCVEHTLSAAGAQV